jgi:hypothetical protein
MSKQRWKPWLKSTGARTQEGKAKSKMNATKHGMRSRVIKDLVRVLTAQRRMLRELR